MIAQRPTDQAYELIERAAISDQLAWWEWSIPDNTVIASPQKVEMIGYDEHDFRDAGFEAYTALLHPDDYERTMEAMRAYLDGRAPLYLIDYRIRTKSGTYVWYMDRGALIERDDEGRPLRLRGIVMNLGPEWDLAARDDSLVAALRTSLPQSGDEHRSVICAQCGRLGYGGGAWMRVDDRFERVIGDRVTHTLCTDCIRLLYPQAAPQIIARLQAPEQRLVRVAILDPMRLVRELVSGQLATEPSIRVVGTFERDRELLDHLQSVGADVALVSSELPDGRLLELIKQIGGQTPQVGLIGYCLCHHNVFAVRALRAGARGFVDATSTRDELVRAVRTVASGGFFVTTSTAERVMTDSLQNADKPLATLSDREFQIMLLLARRMPVGEISSRLNVSESTVATHRRHILQKLDLESNADVTRYAVEEGLISWDEVL